MSAPLFRPAGFEALARELAGRSVERLLIEAGVPAAALPQLKRQGRHLRAIERALGEHLRSSHMDVVCRHYGLRDEPESFGRIGRARGVTRQRAHQLFVAAVARSQQRTRRNAMWTERIVHHLSGRRSPNRASLRPGSAPARPSPSHRS